MRYVIWLWGAKSPIHDVWLCGTAQNMTMKDERSRQKRKKKESIEKN